MAQQFEWDKLKSDANLKKHGVPFDEALTVFADPLARIRDDPDHSVGERREIVVGHSVRDRVLVVGYTERGTKVRIINARRATTKERKNYEEGEKQKGN
jgi:uncharacterized protein